MAPEGTRRVVRRGDLIFATQHFGDPAAPPVLLIMGATASMLWWPDDFCRLLAETGRFVIRYDNRDTGLTTTGAPGPPAYTIDDMADDAIGILDGYGLERAHLVGLSLGGMIGQLCALQHPARVLSLALISSAAFDESDEDLPGMDPALLAHFAGMAGLDWRSRADVVAFRVETSRIATGRHGSFDEAGARLLAEQEFDRAIRPQSAMNHSSVGGGAGWAGRLPELAQPALVIHGRHDPILSLQHGRRLASQLRCARLVELDAGHELRPEHWRQVVDAIALLTA